MPILTSSTILDFFTCPKMYQIKQIHGYHPKGKSWKLEMGIIYHSAVEAMQKRDMKAALAVVKREFQEVFSRDFQNEGFDADRLEQREAIVLGMVENTPWSVSDLERAEDEFLVDLHELAVHIDVEGKYQLAGKIDGIGRNEHGRLLIRDYKTKGDITKSAAPHILSRNFQASFYFYVYQRALGWDDLEGVQFCFVRRPSIKRRTKTKPETNKDFCKRVRKEYALRPEFYYADNITLRDPLDNSFIVNLSHIVKQIDENTKHNRWIENYSQCKGFSGGCVYLPYCTSDIGWADHYDKFGPDHHPELDLKELKGGHKYGTG